MRQRVPLFHLKALGLVSSHLGVIAFYDPIDVILDGWIGSPALLVDRFGQHCQLVG